MNFFKKVFDFISYKTWVLLHKSTFKKLGKSSYIHSPLKVEGSHNIVIGDKVFIGYKAWIAAVSHSEEIEPLLIFGDGCVIGNFNHIYASSKIVFGRKVLTADKVYISDNTHQYSDTTKPILEQPIIQKREVYIGEGTWIGENVCIMGVNIGKNCVIGANSVVTKDLMDYSVAVGNPAYIIKRYCIESNSWKKTNRDGSFIF